MHMQNIFVCVIKAAHAGNFLHVQGIIYMHVHACDGKRYSYLFKVIMKYIYMLV